MQDKNINETETNNIKKNDEKILYSACINVCFACGEDIDKGTKICPYCKTPTV